jgi:cell division septal protein FtsQ
MYTNDGITIMLPEKNPLAAIGTLISLNTNHNILSKDIKLIDMRDSARILVK